MTRKGFEKYSLVLLVFIIFLVGCGIWDANVKEDVPALPPRIGLVLPAAEEAGRGKLLQEGLSKGIEGEGKVDVITAGPADYITSLRKLADRGSDLVWTLGEDMVKSLSEVISLYPEKKFVLVDGNLLAPNVVSLTFRKEEAAFLAGVLAGTVTNTGRIGFLAGPGTEDIQIAIEAGIYEVEPTVQIIGETVADTELADSLPLLKKQLNRGADVIIVGSGVNIDEILAFLQEGEEAVLITLDVYPLPEEDELLASLGWDIGPAVADTLVELIAEFQPGVRSYGIQDNLLVIKEGKRLSPAVRYLLQSYRRQLAEGIIAVPRQEEELLDFQARAAARDAAQEETLDW